METSRLLAFSTKLSSSPFLIIFFLSNIDSTKKVFFVSSFLYLPPSLPSGRKKRMRVIFQPFYYCFKNDKSPKQIYWVENITCPQGMTPFYIKTELSKVGAIECFPGAAVVWDAKPSHHIFNSRKHRDNPNVLQSQSAVCSPQSSSLLCSLHSTRVAPSHDSQWG